MLGFILLLTAPLLIGGLVLSNVFGDDDDDDEVETEEPQIATEQDVFLQPNEDGDFIGTDGVDILLADEEPSAFSGGTVLLGGGDDVALLGRRSGVFDVSENAPTANVFGGDGDDRITNYSGGVTDGGAGDDIIESLANSNVRGGAGDDILRLDATQLPRTFAQGGEFPGEDAILDAGPGADRIELTTNYNGFNDLAGTAQVTGGEGADTFIVNALNANYRDVGGTSGGGPDTS